MANLEGNCKWNFATLPENMLGQSANNALISHFNKSPFSALIREAIQNSLDAPASDDMLVRVEFSFGRIQATEYPNFFELREHIKRHKRDIRLQRQSRCYGSENGGSLSNALE